ncbi:MAG: NAD(P)H-hydrate dehydratase [Desulfarculus sp.]|nr:NAD(P)H-hydrate dehydratase [Pseudomonadota bacterium]MBV1715503.1 NAD(P)H-hydrate dehydratase [Desulfarculus sp.]MBU4574333.1 NAD(P)H-hydrate dehydratase [Pseudomonadota bacterium]MBU4596442.1 NAD(P)H-hydrate dehydratase [Pseudomonadota bacterium]MBV1740326.1 NAD(P)H-hydrate dehydratase [Desulfarculus sp.]
MILVTAEQMRACDQRTINEIGLPGMVLMENAAQGAVRVLLDQVGSLEGARVAVLAGRGNNGGDGLAMARILASQGALCEVYLLAEKSQLTGDAAMNLKVALACGVRVIEAPDEESLEALSGEIARHELFVDALLGTGLSKELSGRFRMAVDLLNQLEAPVMSVDIPSGLCADTGAVLGAAVMADFTATFGLAKQGLLLDGDQYCGELFLVDISIPPAVEMDLEVECHLLEADLVAALLNPRPAGAHKGSFGHLLVVGGSPGKSGAPCLAAMGGLRAGAGLVTACLPAGLGLAAEIKLTAAMSQPLAESAHGGLALEALPTVLELMQTRQALVLGPGLGREDASLELARRLWADCSGSLVMDADGLFALAQGWGEAKSGAAQTVITPHPGEAARLLGITSAQVQADRLKAARELATQGGVVAVLKGARTVIAEPGGAAWINPTGGPLLASGGSGDVLAGVIGGLMAQGLGSLEAALVGAFAHGLAADLAAQEYGQRGLAAEELADWLPQAFAALEGGEEESLEEGAPC